MRIDYCKPESSTGGAHIIFKRQERLESSMLLQVSCWWNLQACTLLSSKNTESAKIYTLSKNTKKKVFTRRSLLYVHNQ